MLVLFVFTGTALAQVNYHTADVKTDIKPDSPGNFDTQPAKPVVGNDVRPSDRPGHQQNFNTRDFGRQQPVEMKVKIVDEQKKNNNKFGNFGRPEDRRNRYEDKKQIISATCKVPYGTKMENVYLVVKDKNNRVVSKVNFVRVPGKFNEFSAKMAPLSLNEKGRDKISAVAIDKNRKVIKGSITVTPAKIYKVWYQSIVPYTGHS